MGHEDLVHLVTELHDTLDSALVGDPDMPENSPERIELLRERLEFRELQLVREEALLAATAAPLAAN